MAYYEPMRVFFWKNKFLKERKYLGDIQIMVVQRFLTVTRHLGSTGLQKYSTYCFF